MMQLAELAVLGTAAGRLIQASCGFRDTIPDAIGESFCSVGHETCLEEVVDHAI
jgi:hypothetical protein